MSELVNLLDDWQKEDIKTDETIPLENINRISEDEKDQFISAESASALNGTAAVERYPPRSRSSSSIKMETFVNGTASYFEYNKNTRLSSRDPLPEMSPGPGEVITKISVEEPIPMESETGIYLETTESNTSIPADIEIFLQEMLQEIRRNQTMIQKRYKVVDNYYWLTKEELLEKPSNRSVTIDLMPDAFDSARSAVLYAEEPRVTNIITRTERHVTRIGTDQVDGVGRSDDDVALVIFRDDVKSLKNTIEKETDVVALSKIYRRILEAVEFNSLNCLDFLCEEYDQKAKECQLSQEKFKNNTTLFHRRFGLNWPLSDRIQQSPLHLIASRCSAVKAMKIVGKYPILMENLVDEPDNHNSTPLLIAVKKNNTIVAKRLINNNIKQPEFWKKNDDGDSPICVAALSGQAGVVEDMLDKCMSSKEDFERLEKNDELYGKGHSILYVASQSGNSDILDVLLDIYKQEGEEFKLLKIEKDHPTDWNTFVCNVCASGCERLLTELIGLGSPIEKCEDSTEATPLMRAAEADQLKIVMMLLDTEAVRETMSAVDINGRNVFHYAVVCPKVLEYLLMLYQMDVNLDVINRKAKDGCSPLQLAATRNNESFKMLLECKNSEADLFCRPFVGYNDIGILTAALENWERRSPEQVLEFLHGDGDYQPLLQAAENGDVDMMRVLIVKGAKEEQRGFDDSTALHYAVIADKLPVVEYLVAEFPDIIDMTNDRGETAAACATAIGNVEILKFLLNKGAKLTSDNKKDRVNILDCSFGYFKKAEETIMEIIKFCNVEDSPDKLKELLEDSHFGPDRLMAKLIEDIPSVAMEIYDQCFRRQSGLRNHSYAETESTLEKKIIYHFFPFNGNKQNVNFESIKSMVKFERDECLGHPVVRKFLDLRFFSSATIAWYLYDILMYTLFLVSLSTYIVLQTKDSFTSKSSVLVGLSFVILIVAILNLMKEFLQVVASQMDYFYQFDNYMEWAMYICAAIFVMGDTKTNVQIGSGAIAIFFAWINFILYLQWFSLFGIYIVMTKRVFITVCKVLPMVFLFIIAFAMAFSMLMPQDNGFGDISTSFLTTFVMMSGEIDFRDTFLGYNNSAFHHLQRIFLVLFLILVCITIMNLLTGLAVDDTNEIMERSRQERRLHEAKRVLVAQRILSYFPNRTALTFEPFVENNSEKKPLWKKIVSVLKVGEEFDDFDQVHEIDLEDIDKHLKTISEDNQKREKDKGEQLDNITEELKQEMATIDNSRGQEVDEQLSTLSQRCDAIADHFTERMAALLESNEVKEQHVLERFAQMSQMTEDNEKKLEKSLKKMQTLLEIMECNVESTVNDIKQFRK